MARLNARLEKVEQRTSRPTDYRRAFSRWLQGISDDELDALERAARRGQPDGEAETTICDRLTAWARTEGWIE